MKINDVIEAFNKALQRIKTKDKINPFFVATVNVEKKIGTIKEFTIRVFLVDQLTSYRSVVLKKTVNFPCPESEVNKAAEGVFCMDIIPDLVLLFNKYKDDLGSGNYESLVNMEDGTKQ